ncbi:hypothetical protein CYMTET_37565 [Cymbomonas tetramitiformis]|uniref:Uncharacterized protein n=1 Tax=Cymbomonas tetramitiformis TaxID=36881 RepID=A0AAE0CF04_9CHLO|nr:hypothetical protein CYMTET_37565 [Cymbomonas tetramitiformis]
MQDVDAQETAAQETTPGEAERCFPFDLMESYYCVGIILDFQKFMQFDVRGKLYQCSALPFKWNDSPRIFVNFMKVLAEVLPSPIAIRDRQDLWRPSAECEEGAVVSVQVVEHLGLAVNLKEGVFRVMQTRLDKIISKATNLLCKASPEQRATGDQHEAGCFQRAVSVGVPGSARSHAVPTGTLLCAGQEEEIGGEGEAHETVVWQSRAVEAPSGAMQVDRMEDLEVSNTGEDAHGAFSLRVGVVLNLKLEARGFWRDERHLQFMHLEIEAVFKTPQGGLAGVRLGRREQLDQPAQGTPERSGTQLWEENAGGTVVSPYWLGQSWVRELEMIAKEMAASETMGAMVTERMWLLAKHACTYVALTIVSFGRPDTGMLLLQENAFMEGVKMVLTQEKCKNHQRKKPQLSFHWWGVERPWELLKLWMWCGMRPDTVQSRGGPINRCAGQLLAAAEGTSLTDTDTDTDTDLANEWLQQAGNVGSVHPKGEGIFPLTPPGRGLRSVPVLWVW